MSQLGTVLGMTEACGFNREGAPGWARYPEYKDSGVGWLGEIPAHWEVRRADGLFRCEKIQIDPSMIDDDLAFHYSIPSIQETGDGVLESVDSIGSAKLRITGKRILVSRLNPRKGVVLVATVRAPTTVCSTEFVPLKLRSSSVVLKWAYFAIAAESTRQRLSARVNSATRSHQRVDVADVLKMWHAVPPPVEQQAIADILDRASARIDALIAKQQELIRLLQEKRTALISHAVTRGLDHDVPMRDSGAEWLGKIPAGWKVSRNKQLFREVDDRSRIGSETLLSVSEYFGVRPRSHVIDDGEWLTRAESLVGYKLCQPGDLAMNFMLAWKRGLGFSKYSGLVSPSYAVFRPLVAIHHRYFHFLLRSTHAVREFRRRSYGIIDSRLRLYPDTFGNLLSPVPPLAEQRAIADFLDREKAKVDALVGKATDAITLLNEYRTALISAAVTGKIDVRRALEPTPNPTTPHATP